MNLLFRLITSRAALAFALLPAFVAGCGGGLDPILGTPGIGVVPLTPSIGIALYPDHGTSGQTLMAHADAAMYCAKQLRSPCEFFEPAMASSPASRRQTD